MAPKSGPTRAIIRAALCALLLLSNPALAVDLFEGNLGYNGDWLHVLDAPGMGDRIYWYDLGEDVTYHAQCAEDEGFAAPALEETGISTNYLTPDLVPGFYFFRVRETHSSGTSGSWSENGTLQIVEDRELPTAEILWPVEGQSVSAGSTIPVQLEVSDDTVPHLARFTVNGNYAGTLGLKTENYKVKPSFGTPRTFVFDLPLPSKGKGGATLIEVVVSDVSSKAVTTSVMIDVAKSNDTGKTSRGGGRKK